MSNLRVPSESTFEPVRSGLKLMLQLPLEPGDWSQRRTHEKGHLAFQHHCSSNRPGTSDRLDEAVLTIGA
jgi:hypothetical protein